MEKNIHVVGMEARTAVESPHPQGSRRRWSKARRPGISCFLLDTGSATCASDLELVATPGHIRTAETQTARLKHNQQNS